MVDWNGTLYFYMGTRGNLRSVPSVTWVDMPTFMLIASISCQHPHIIHHPYSSLHVCWSAFLSRWFVEWRCGQVPRIRLCLWWVEMSKVILCFWVLIPTSLLLSCPFWCMMVDWNGTLYFLMRTLVEICGVCHLQSELTSQLLCWLLALILMPTPPHYSPLLFFSPCLVECILRQVICRVTMWTSA